MKPKDVRASKSLRRSIVIAGVSGALGGYGLLRLVSWTAPLPPSPGMSALSFALGAAFIAVPILTGGAVLHWLTEFDQQRRALINIRPLYGVLPLPLSDAAADPVFAELLVGVLRRRRPRLVLECGSGSSTVIAAACLKALGSGRVLSLEHDARYADATRELIRQQGLEEWAEVLHAPLVDQTVDGETYRWYSLPPPERLEAGVDLLVVDGPPRTSSRDARYPAVPLLRSDFAPDIAILMDDGNRPEERSIARRWGKELNLAAEQFTLGKGAWLLAGRVRTADRQPEDAG